MAGLGCCWRCCGAQDGAVAPDGASIELAPAPGARPGRSSTAACCALLLPCLMAALLALRPSSTDCTARPGTDRQQRVSPTLLSRHHHAPAAALCCLRPAGSCIRHRPGPGTTPPALPCPPCAAAAHRCRSPPAAAACRPRPRPLLARHLHSLHTAQPAADTQRRQAAAGDAAAAAAGSVGLQQKRQRSAAAAAGSSGSDGGAHQGERARPGQVC